QLIEAILGQAGPAFVEVLADLRDVRRVELAVQVGVDPVQHLGTRGLVRVPAAHLSSSPEPLSSPCGPVAEAARTRPRSAAQSRSTSRNCLRPRCSRDITVPMGVPMMPAISL